MAGVDGAGAGPNVMHDEFMEENDSEGESGEEGDAARARQLKPIEEELEDR